MWGLLREHNGWAILEFERVLGSEVVVGIFSEGTDSPPSIPDILANNRKLSRWIGRKRRIEATPGRTSDC